YDDLGIRLTKSAKRTKIKIFMENLYNNQQENQVTLKDGSTAQIIVARRYEGRATFYYFNTFNAPKTEILKSFAELNNISYVEDKPEPKKHGELIAQEVLHLLDDVKVNGNKVTGDKKRAKTILMFQQLYKDKQRNICILPNGEIIPIIILATGDNNRMAYCLNTSVYRKEVLRSFAERTDCVYLEYKEDDTIPADKHPLELTARNCAKLFHGVESCPIGQEKQERKEYVLQWFYHIYGNPDLNKVTLPDGKTVDLLVRRLSHSQRCLCLNTSNASIKPFVLKRFADISRASFCFDNLDVSKDDKKELVSSIRKLALAENNSTDDKDKEFYLTYCQQVFDTLKLKTEHISVSGYFADKLKKSYSD
ncbi:MAG: hypothetical protein IKW39_02270, partial [Alphaproteobacteria bacterium]|nr:hypothetical protein [Alphaproteobacteria bacterium]